MHYCHQVATIPKNLSLLMASRLCRSTQSNQWSTWKKAATIEEYFWADKINARGHRDRKKMCGVAFFSKPSFGGLTNYVIRHRSIYGNMTSLLCPHAPRYLPHRPGKPTLLVFVRGAHTEGGTTHGCQYILVYRT